MNKLVSMLFLLMLSAESVFAQKDNDQQRTVSVTKVTFFEPGLAHEFPLGKTSSFMLRGGLTGTIALDYNDEPTGFLLRLFAAGTGRVYYNFPKREEQGKNIEKNSANYFALLILLGTQPLNKGTDYDLNLNNTLLNTGVVWGMQRNYPSGFSLDLSIGVGYAKVGTLNSIAPVGEFNIGWCLGRKNK